MLKFYMEFLVSTEQDLTITYLKKYLKYIWLFKEMLILLLYLLKYREAFLAFCNADEQGYN